jgi:hypothetical protein
VRDWRGCSSPTLVVRAGEGSPFRTGDRNGGGDGDRAGDHTDRPHLAYPSRRTFACRAVSLIVGPSTKGSRFALWEAEGAAEIPSGWLLPSASGQSGYCGVTHL